MLKKVVMALVITTPLVIFSLIKLFLSPPKQSSINLGKLTINSQLFKAEIADTQEKRTAGLSGRTDLAEDQGMLFIFPQEGIYPFWMKDMLIPLDFVWINKGVVIDLSKNIPPPLNSTDPPASLIPTKTIDMVFELTAGSIDLYQIKIGDRVELQK